jgi:hypothetical protein
MYSVTVVKCRCTMYSTAQHSTAQHSTVLCIGTERNRCKTVRENENERDEDR